MFCINCGTKVEEGARFCIKCGKEIQHSQASAEIQPIPREPVCPSCGEKIIQGNKFCIKCGTPVGTTAATTPIPHIPVQAAPPPTWAFGGVTPHTAELPKKKSKLLLAAIIVAPVLLVIWVSVIFIQDYNELKNIEKREFPSGIFGEVLHREAVRPVEEKTRAAIFILVLGLVFFAISTLLIVNGKKKNENKTIQAAGILYFITGFGIPSAVMCFIAFSKMKT